MNSTRNIEINGTSPKEDVLVAIDGVWASTKQNDWVVTRISTRLEIWQRWCSKSGSYMLPRTADKTIVVKVFNNDGTTACKIVKIGNKAVNVTKPCFLEVLLTLDS